MMKYYNVYQIDYRTWRIEDCFRSYMYLIQGSRQAVLFDTGIGMPGLAECVRQLTDKTVWVINSHGHLDHVGGNPQFSQCFLHPKDEDVLEEHTRADFRKPLIESFIQEFQMEINQDEADKIAQAGRKTEYLPVRGGQVFDLGERWLELLETPGHTRGSLCMLDKESRLLFSADTVCERGVLLFFPYSATVAEFYNSILHLKERSSEYEQIWPGHHKCPLNRDYLDKYLVCAEKILSCPEAGERICSNLGEGRIQYYQDISITY